MREEWHPAGFVDRFGADFLDGLFLNILVVPTAVLVDRLVPKSAAGFLGGDPASVAADLMMAVWFFWNLTYQVGKTGQSWGRRVSGLRVVNADGEPIGFWRAL